MSFVQQPTLALGNLATIPAQVEQATTDDVTYAINCSEYLQEGQTVASATAFLKIGTQQVSLPDSPTVQSDNVTVNVRIPPGILTARSGWLMVLVVSIAGTTNLLTSVTSIAVPL